MSTASIRRALPANNVSASVTTAQVFSQQSNSLLAASLSAPGKLVLEQKKFRIRASGYLTTAGSYTVVATLLGAVSLPGTPLTASNWTVLGANSAVTIATASAPWWIEADLLFDSISTNMVGDFSSNVNNTFGAWAAISNKLTGINGTNQTINSVAPADPVAYFAAALTFGTANVANLGVLNELVLEF